jgi:hypothetical protein
MRRGHAHLRRSWSSFRTAAVMIRKPERKKEQENGGLDQRA